MKSKHGKKIEKKMKPLIKFDLQLDPVRSEEAELETRALWRVSVSRNPDGTRRNIPTHSSRDGI